MPQKRVKYIMFISFKLTKNWQYDGHYGDLAAFIYIYIYIFFFFTYNLISFYERFEFETNLRIFVNA